MKKIVAILLSVYGMSAFADSLNEPRTIKRIFSEGIASAGFMSSEGFTQRVTEGYRGLQGSGLKGTEGLKFDHNASFDKMTSVFQ